MIALLLAALLSAPRVPVGKRNEVPYCSDWEGNTVPPPVCPPPPSCPTVGRYVIVIVPATPETHAYALRMDTATGETWASCHDGANWCPVP